MYINQPVVEPEDYEDMVGEGQECSDDVQLIENGIACDQQWWLTQEGWFYLLVPKPVGIKEDGGGATDGGSGAMGRSF